MMDRFELDRRAWLIAAFASIAAPALAQRAGAPHGAGLANTTLLLIRHAEKPDKDDANPGLTPAGERRAKAYAKYFSSFELDGQKLHIDTIVATADTRKSQRPRLTVTPLSQALNLPIQQPFADDDVKGLAHWLEGGAPARTVLIAWHHGRLPALLAELGADPKSLMPDGVWPSTIYDWVMALRYDEHSRLVLAKVVHEPMGLET